jgi:tripartite-type tricarboxylate transporter receptor subunit TctC
MLSRLFRARILFGEFSNITRPEYKRHDSQQQARHGRHRGVRVRTARGGDAMTGAMTSCRCPALALAAAMWLTPCAMAAEFYQGKQVTIVVGFSSAGTYDATARLFARHLGKYLPGKPAVIVRNMPGAGSLVAANSLYNSAPKDGTTLGVIGGGVVLEPLLGNAQANYDPRRFTWIGGRTRDNFLCLVWHTVPVQTLQDATKRETVVGATGPGSRTLTYPKALNELLGTKFKIVSGYPGGNEITLALERGEVEGYCGWALGSIKTRAPDWIRDGKIRPLAQFTLAKTSDLPNVPLATDLARTNRERRAIEFFAADSVLAWPLMAPPDVPAERLSELRSAFTAMMRDPELLAEAAKQGLDIDPVSGAEITELVSRLYSTPPDVLDLVRKINAAR